ncbi:hypothetical protein LTR09_009521 [Extremus antarcticus]|uniref:S-adenosyl-L-methionine-dependent methyltransferase n=1 Tax=Extremus antarcticus TaxID=702011 RepID=A0AAJ0DFU5_9PEZI|nr:hypothetical protein LTR09_009521 [Extremus antarcticus]
MPRTLRPQHVASSAPRATTRSPAPVHQPIHQQVQRPTIPLQPQPAAPAPPQPRLPNAYRYRATPWVLGSLLAGGLGFYTAKLLIAARTPCQNPGIAELVNQKDVSARYDDTADSFDSEVGISETLMGINRMRRELAQQCSGHVLEASCGTGRNLGYFDLGKEGKVESLTFVDLSPGMVEVCMRKWHILHDSKTGEMKPGLQVRFLKGSVIEKMPPAPGGKEKGGYDTIIQTMGLCSTPEPVELLENLVRHLDVSNPEARILLLEHGRSDREWMNNILDNAAEKHAEIHGCWFNRDIGALVEQAARKTGMEVVMERRRHVGTTWVFELKPGPGMTKPNIAAAAASSVGSEEVQQSTWTSWLGWK